MKEIEEYSIEIFNNPHNFPNEFPLKETTWGKCKRNEILENIDSRKDRLEYFYDCETQRQCFKCLMTNPHLGLTLVREDIQRALEDGTLIEYINFSMEKACEQYCDYYEKVVIS